jgi:hypothetical protein
MRRLYPTGAVIRSEDKEYGQRNHRSNYRHENPVEEHRDIIHETLPRVSHKATLRAWRVFLANRTEADFQAWRDQQVWTAEKYRRVDRGEQMPPEGRPAWRGATVADGFARFIPTALGTGRSPAVAALLALHLQPAT